MEVSVELSVVSATAASGGRSASKRLTSSAAKCCASAAEPPLPHASTLPPPFSERASSCPACAIGSPSTRAASLLRRALSAKWPAIRSSSFASVACISCGGFYTLTVHRPRTPSCGWGVNRSRTGALLAKRIANPLHMTRRPIDQEDIEATDRLGTPRKVKARGGDDTCALRSGDAFGGAAEVAGRAHAHFGEHQRAAAVLGDDIDLAEPAAPVALDELQPGGAHEIGAQVLGSRTFAVHGTLNE